MLISLIIDKKYITRESKVYTKQGACAFETLMNVLYTYTAHDPFVVIACVCLYVSMCMYVYFTYIHTFMSVIYTSMAHDRFVMACVSVERSEMCVCMYVCVSMCDYVYFMYIHTLPLTNHTHRHAHTFHHHHHHHHHKQLTIFSLSHPLINSLPASPHPFSFIRS